MGEKLSIENASLLERGQFPVHYEEGAGANTQAKALESRRLRFNRASTDVFFDVNSAFGTVGPSAVIFNACSPTVNAYTTPSSRGIANNPYNTSGIIVQPDLPTISPQC